jgi:hypothetical protein
MGDSMAKRTTKTTKKTTKSVKKRKTATRQKTSKTSRKSPRKKTARKTPTRKAQKVAHTIETPESLAVNRQALWNTYRDLQSRVDHALDKLRMHFNTRAMPHVLLEDKKELLFLLGECNYMARTCAELDSSDQHSR